MIIYPPAKVAGVVARTLRGSLPASTPKMHPVRPRAPGSSIPVCPTCDGVSTAKKCVYLPRLIIWVTFVEESDDGWYYWCHVFVSVTMIGESSVSLKAKTASHVWRLFHKCPTEHRLKLEAKEHEKSVNGVSKCRTVEQLQIHQS